MEQLQHTHYIPGYETAHNMTFFMAVLSNKHAGIADLALKYDVMQNTLPRLINDGYHIEFVTQFVNHNQEKIKRCMDLGNKTMIRDWLIKNGRNYKQPNEIFK